MAIVIESEKSGRYIPILERYFLFRIYFFILLRSPLKKTYSYSRILDTVFTKLSLTLVYDQT